MTEITMSTTLDMPFAAADQRVREALAEAGFGVLTTIDLEATLRSRLGVDTAPRVVLGACRPDLAYRALEADARVAAMLPCNVVITSTSDSSSQVDVMDPSIMVTFSSSPDVAEVAAEARERLAGMLASLDRPATGVSHVPATR